MLLSCPRAAHGLNVLRALPARQSKELRSIDATIPWEIKHMSGLCHHAERLSMFAVGRCKGYNELGIEASWQPLRLCMNDCRVKLSDDFSWVLTDLSVNITLELCRRNLGLTHALPRRQSLLVSAEHAQPFIDGLRRDHDIFKAVAGLEFPGKDILLSRSVFNLTPV